jgi:hypothetical protein
MKIKHLRCHHVDAIIHLAGKAHDTKNATEEKAYFDINVGSGFGEFAGRFEINNKQTCLLKMNKF